MDDIHKNDAHPGTQKPKAVKPKRTPGAAPISAREMVFRLNPASARYAVVFAEIIGQPVSKRQRRSLH